MNSICFDTETTGLHPNGSDPDEILTVSIIGRDGSVLLDERFRPTVKTEWPHASAINGIYPEDVADLPTIETAIPRLREIFAGADEVIGYNVGFDLGFLSAVGVRPREDAPRRRIGTYSRGSWEGVTSWWMPPTTSDTSGRAGHTVRLPTRSRRLPCSDGSNNGS